MGITAIHVDDVPIERMEEKHGWAISEFRLPITGETGSATTVFHSIFRPGSTHAKHLHTASDEIAVYLSGYGVVGQGDSRAVVSAGHCRMMPKGSTHFFYNETKDEDAEVIGFYMNAPDVAGTGYEFHGKVEQADLERPREGLNDGILVELGKSDPLNGDAVPAWAPAEVRNPVGSHNGSENALLHVALPNGRAIGAHRLGAEAIWFINRGDGVAKSDDGEQALRRGHFVFVPAGDWFALTNTGDGPLEAFVVLTGAGSLAEADPTAAATA